MNRHTRTVVIAGCLMSVGVAMAAGSDSAYLGILFDPTPLPEILTKHLELESGQGLRVQNVQKNGPADRAGIGRDDIVIELNGEPVTDFHAFLDTVSQHHVGEKVTLQILHLGKQRRVEITLAARASAFNPKFPPEPLEHQHIAPGRIWRFHHGPDRWVEIDKEMKPELPEVVKAITQELYVFHYQADGNHPACTVSIHGDPHDEESTLIIKQQGKEYTTTVDSLDRLPGNTQARGEQALERAKHQARQKIHSRMWWQHSNALRDFLRKRAPAAKEGLAYIPDVLKRHLHDKESFTDTPRSIPENDQPRIEQLKKELDQLKERLKALEALQANEEGPV